MGQILQLPFVRHHVARYAQHLMDLHTRGMAELSASLASRQQQQQQQQQQQRLAGGQAGSKPAGEGDASPVVMIRAMAVGQGFSEDSCMSAEDAAAAAGAAAAGAAAAEASGLSGSGGQEQDSGSGSAGSGASSSFNSSLSSQQGGAGSVPALPAFEECTEDEQGGDAGSECSGAGEAHHQVVQQQQGAQERQRQRMIGATWFANQQAALLDMQQAWHNIGSSPAAAAQQQGPGPSPRQQQGQAVAPQQGLAAAGTPVHAAQPKASRAAPATPAARLAEPRPGSAVKVQVSGAGLVSPGSLLGCAGASRATQWRACCPVGTGRLPDQAPA